MNLDTEYIESFYLISLSLFLIGSFIYSLILAAIISWDRKENLHE